MNSTPLPAHAAPSRSAVAELLEERGCGAATHEGPSVTLTIHPRISE